VTVPERAHPIVRFIFAEMKRQGVTYAQMSERSGLARETITAWRTRNKPDLDSIEAALGVLGYRLSSLIEEMPAALSESAMPQIVARRVADAAKRSTPGRKVSPHMARELEYRSLQSVFDLIVGAKPQPFSSLIARDDT
jgi:transcriptional regulator with XRE-family HTH domain